MSIPSSIRVLFMALLVAIVCGLSGSGVRAAGEGISGTVTNLALEPIAGATVEACLGGGSCHSATTAPDGTYLISGLGVHDYTVGVSAAGYVREYYDNVLDEYDATSVEVLDSQVTPNINFALTPEGTISGTVTEAGNGPLEGAWVVAYDIDGSGELYMTSSDSSGAYTMHWLPAGNYRVCVWAAPTLPEYVDECYDGVRDQDAATPVAVTAGHDTPNIDFQLDLGGTISGTVTDTNGPIEGAYISACPEHGGGCRSATTGIDGTYEVEGLVTDCHTVWASDEGYVTEYYDDVRDEEDADCVSVTEGQPTSGIDFELAVGGTILGMVTDGVNPLGGVDVEACLDPDYQYCVERTTAGDGYYEIPSLAGGNYVVRTYSGYADEYYNDKPSRNDADLVDVVEGEETPNIDFTLGPPGTISGTVMDTDGDPIAGADITACPEDDCESAESAADGTYTITGLDYFAYIVRAEAEGYVREYWQDARRSADATPVPVSEGNLNQTGIDFHLDVGGTISGTVTAGGNPVEGATVSAFDPSDPWGTLLPLVTDAGGDYVITSVGAGSYLVSAIQEGYAWEYYHEVRWEEDATAVPVTDGQETENINFTLDVGGSICGTVRDKDGNPIAGADVYANPQNHEEPWWWWIFQGFMGSDFMDNSELDGTYAIGHLGAGSYVVRASAAGYDDKYYNAVAEREGADPVPVTEGYSSCSIDFVFGSDEPVPGPTFTPTPTPTATATPGTLTPTPKPKPTKTHTPKPTPTRTPGPTTTPVLVLPTATPLPPLPPPAPSSVVLPSLVAPPTGSGPAEGGSPWTAMIWLLAAAGGAGVAMGGYLRLAKRRRF